MTLLRKRPEYRYTPAVPGSPALAAAVQCPPPGEGYTYVERGGSYVRVRQTNPFTPPRNPGDLVPGLCIQPYTGPDGGTVFGPCGRSG